MEKAKKNTNKWYKDPNFLNIILTIIMLLILSGGIAYNFGVENTKMKDDIKYVKEAMPLFKDFIKAEKNIKLLKKEIEIIKLENNKYKKEIIKNTKHIRQLELRLKNYKKHKTYKTIGTKIKKL